MRAWAQLSVTALVTSTVLTAGYAPVASAVIGANQHQTPLRSDVTSSHYRAQTATTSENVTYRIVNSTSQIAEVKRTMYDKTTHQVRIDAALYGEPSQRLRAATLPSAYRTGDNKIDLSTASGLVNFATSKFVNQTVKSVHFVAHSSQRSGMHRDFTVQVPKGLQQPVASGLKPVVYPTRTAHSLPPGVRLQKTGTALADRGSSASTKADAVVTTARQLTGSAYLWGANPKRRPTAFDTGTFTAYVYQKALGYNIPNNARAQSRLIGWQESRAQWQAGDLLVFDNGSQVGIYLGNNHFMQASEGTNQVNSFSIDATSPWYPHLTSVRRMF